MCVPDYVQNSFTCILACVTWLHHPALLPLHDLLNRIMDLPLEDQGLERPCPVPLQFIPAIHGEVLHASSINLLDQHLMMARLQ